MSIMVLPVGLVPQYGSFVHNGTPSVQEESWSEKTISIFDGIATGFVALKNFGLSKDAHFYSEIELDAIRVAEMHFGGKIIMCAGRHKGLGCFEAGIHLVYSAESITML
ncbi:hypothetical protein LSTR_LSTR009547 [Laodelphax striatellus]|uniref:Uncharacterized protein n=1 Tax=Laodelphax striatellus TaxID=195883 RepID=A0A482WTF2_LAOST|nr:hypothetical protein LSTR_LSTR009547 [Laodelphax striatellus]